MRVTLTGAAGQIGIHVCRGLLNAAHQVQATDKVSRPDTPVPLHTADLLDAQAVNAVVSGADAVVHLGNHSSFHPPKPRMILTENVAMNMNVFQAAADAGVKRIVFASSIQALRYELERPDIPSPPLRPHYLPMDGDLPAEPLNPYGLSKQVGEVMLEYFARRHGISGVALRLPGVAVSRPSATDKTAMYCPYLTIGDVVELIVAILSRELPGFRVYLPARTLLPPGVSPSDVIAKHYDHLPRRGSVEQTDSLVDISRIERETGWTPQDLPLPQ